MGSENGNSRRVSLCIEDGVARITLNRPECLNAFVESMRDDLSHRLREAADHPETRVLVLTGAGRGFCTGADVDAMSELLEQGDTLAFERLIEAGMRVIRAIRSIPQPVIAAVNGPAAGAGASLALACDLRLASERASIGITFGRIGLHPDWGATYFLPRLVGAGRAMELALSGRMVPAAEAERIGLVERVIGAESFASEVMEFAADLARKPPIALAAVKQTLNRSFGSDLEAMLSAEEEAQLRCFRSADAREGIAAFRGKRMPRFQGS